MTRDRRRGVDGSEGMTEKAYKCRELLIQGTAMMSPV